MKINLNSKIKYIPFFLLLAYFIVFSSGCASGGQKVKWDKSEAIDKNYGVKIEVSADIEIPENEMDFLKDDISAKVKEVLKGDDENYTLKVIISKYDEGSAFARFMLAGLGSMHLHGTVELTSGDPPVIVRSGGFEKYYGLGGFAGGFATMHKDMISKVGKAIAKALEEEPK